MRIHVNYDAGDGAISLTMVDENDTSKGIVTLDANEVAKFIKELKEAFLSIAGF